MKKLKTLLVFSLVLSMVVAAFAGCQKKESEPVSETTETATEAATEATTEAAPENAYTALDTQAEGDITIMTWSGSGQYMEDLGKQELTVAELTGQNEAAIYAMAKEFNKTYPNIKINVYSKAGGPHDNETSWAQELENFKANYGKYPDIFASTDLVGDVKKGMVADLSVFADDPVYQSFNRGVMGMMNYYGFQAGLPMFMQPWGVYVNKELATQNNIDIPPVNWTLDEYTTFATSSDNETFWGAMDVPMGFINAGSNLYSSLYNYSGEGDYANFNGEDVNKLLEYVPKWATSAIWTQNDVGGVPQELMESNGWWGFNFFINNYILTLDGDPWMMGDAANPAEGHWGTVKSNDWDIYPRPSTEYQDNTIGVVIDPMALHNFAMDDGNAEWSDEEKAKLQVAYTFASYWLGSSEAMQARANQNFTNNGTERTSLNDSFPLVTGAAFDEQMDIWFSTPTHARYADAAKMPGFQKVIEIWEAGQFWDVSDKTYHFYVTVDGSQVPAMNEWLSIYQKDLVGALRTDANWLDQVKAKLPDWNTTINGRLAEAEQQLKDGLVTYYGFTEADFQ